MNVVTNAPSTAVRSVVDAYFAAWNGTEASRPLVGMQRHIYVADTDEEALTAGKSKDGRGQSAQSGAAENSGSGNSGGGNSSGNSNSGGR